MNLIKTFFLFFSGVNSQLLGANNDPSGNGCVTDGGYEWCKETNSCVRSWETSCPSLNYIMEPGPVIDPIYPKDPLPYCGQCPPPAPCPMPYMDDINLKSCKLKTNTDKCGCNIGCPSYDCSNTNDLPDIKIPDNCATWYDGCNTCQVRDGKAEICTLMYCFTQNKPQCMNFYSNTLNLNDICYRFCEDNSEKFIDKKDLCPGNSQCISSFNKNSVSMIAYDSCNDRAWTCQNIDH